MKNVALSTCCNFGARANKPIAQLRIYALALTRLMPGLRLFDIKCAWFNEHEYCEPHLIRAA